MNKVNKYLEIVWINIKNVHFIISSSNNQKVIDNIQSRTIIIKLKNISNENLNLIYEKIVTNEDIHVEKMLKNFYLIFLIIQ